MAKLVGTAGVIAGREFPLGELCIIGRSPNAQVRLADLSVSRQHAKVTRSVNGYIIEDLDSGLGTLVNKRPITVAHLKHNDIITISDTSFRFVDGPIKRVQSSDFSLVYDAQEAQVVSVDASEFAQLQPVDQALDAATIAKLTRRLNAMLAMGRAATSRLQPDALLQEVLRYCLEVFPSVDRALVAVPNRQTQSLVVRALVMREGIALGEFSLSHTITSEVLNKGRSVISNTGSGEDGPALELMPASARSMMVSPLICRGQMLGLIYVDRIKDGPPFAEEDLEILTGMATQIALALNNAQLHESMILQSRTEQELIAAHEVQKRFMPRGVPKLPGFTFVAHYDPSKDVGGDLYDFIPLDDDHVGIVVGDVSGKGFAAALVMAWVASQLRLAAHLERGPVEVLQRVNSSLLEARQDDLFITLFYGVLDRESMTVRFCNAGHIPPLVRRAEIGDVELIETGAGLPVGVVSGAKFEEGIIQLDPGDSLLVVTDGVTEAMDPDKNMFGLDGLQASVAFGSANATDLVCNVLGGIRSFVRGEIQYDDITIVAVGVSEQVEDIRATLPPGAFSSFPPF